MPIPNSPTHSSVVLISRQRQTIWEMMIAWETWKHGILIANFQFIYNQAYWLFDIGEHKMQNMVDILVFD